MDANIVDIFYLVDEFCKEFDKAKAGHILQKDCGKKSRKRQFRLSDSEVITIMIYFHLKQFRNLKHFYVNYIQEHCKGYFPDTVSYNRFVELQQKAVLPMSVFLKMCCLGKCTGISFIDATSLKVCHIKRERSNKTFKGLATKGKTTIGWFFGFKLHIVINDKGEILDFVISQANTDDRQPLKDKNFHKRVFGKLFGDKGYISNDLFEKLFVDGIHLITRIKKNMKNSLMLMSDKIYLRKRALIETVNDQLKNICQIEHTRHRCFPNFIGNMVSGLIAYNFLPKKPSLNLEIVDIQDIKIEKIAA
jgi:hypothetical protein